MEIFTRTNLPEDGACKVVEGARRLADEREMHAYEISQVHCPYVEQCVKGLLDTCPFPQLYPKKAKLIHKTRHN